VTSGRPPAVSGRVTRWLLSAGLASAVLLCVALPGLVVGAQIDAPPAPGELERLAAAFDGSIGSEIARQFELAAVPESLEWPSTPAEQLRLLSSARLMQAFGILALSMLLYLAVLLARGRVAGVIACLALACTPAVFEQGHVLRPETAATAFTALAVVLLQCMAQAVYGSRTRGPRRRAIVLVLLAVSAAFAIGLAVGAVPTMGGTLLIPIALFMLTTLQLVLRGFRISWRRTFFAWPALAMTQRLWAHALAAVLAPSAALLCMLVALRVAYDEIRPSGLATSVLPTGTAAASVLLVLAILGGITFVLRTGIRFGRRGRVGADLVLLAYAGTQIAYAAGSEVEFDPLPAAPAFAVLVGEGAFAILAGVLWVLRRRS